MLGGTGGRVRRVGGWVGRVENLCMNVCSGINCGGAARTFAID
jgi:hypothetical protein